MNRCSSVSSKSTITVSLVDLYLSGIYRWINVLRPKEVCEPFCYARRNCPLIVFSPHNEFDICCRSSLLLLILTTQQELPLR